MDGDRRFGSLAQAAGLSSLLTPHFPLPFVCGAQGVGAAVRILCLEAGASQRYNKMTSCMHVLVYIHTEPTGCLMEPERNKHRMPLGTCGKLRVPSRLLTHLQDKAFTEVYNTI